MVFKDMLLALAPVVLWGLNFVVVKVGLNDEPPLLLAAMRFLLLAFPAVFFIKKPVLPWRLLIAYAATIVLAQFALLFTAMHLGMPAGLASLVLQSQVFFTLLFALFTLGERLRATSIAGVLLAVAGLAVIGSNSGQSMTFIGFVLTLCSASMWALGNIVTKKIGRVDPFGLVVWAGLLAIVPFLLLSLWVDGPQAIERGLSSFSWVTALTVAYLAFGSSLAGYGIWSRLLGQYPAGIVAPYTLLVPVVGLWSADIFLGETVSVSEWAGIVLVMLGLAAHVFGPRLLPR